MRWACGTEGGTTVEEKTKQEPNWFVRSLGFVVKLEERYSKAAMTAALLAVLVPLEFLLINANGYLTDLRKDLTAPPTVPPPLEIAVKTASISFPDRQEGPFGEVSVASEPLLVLALVKAGERERSVVCGYASTDERDLQRAGRSGSLQASAGVHYGFKTDAPVTSISMFVAAEEFWLVDYCDGEDPLSFKPSVYTEKLSVSLK